MNKILPWTGTVTSILGSFTVAFGIMFAGYVLFMVGSCSWLIAAYQRKDRALAILNLFFFCANIIGLYRSV